MIVTAYPSGDVTRDEFTRAGHEFTTSDLCGIDFDLRLSRGRSKNNRRKDKSCNDGRAAHDHAPFRGRAKTSLPDRTNNRYDPSRTTSFSQRSAEQWYLIHVRGCYPPQCMSEDKQEDKRMLRLFAVAGFALAVTTSAQAITPAPLPQPDGMITQVRLGCGPFRTRVNGVCVARTTIRHTRRMARRAYRRGTLPPPQ